MLTKDKDQAQQKVIDVLKEGPHKYYKVSVKRAIVRETEYFVKHKVSDGEFNAYDHIPHLSMNSCPDEWTEVYDDPCADEYDPEIESVENVDEHGNELK